MTEQEALNQELATSRLLEAPLNLEELARAIAERAVELSGLDGCFLHLRLDGDADRLFVAHGAAPPTSVLPHPMPGCESTALREWLGAAPDDLLCAFAVPPHGPVSGCLVVHAHGPWELGAGREALLQALAEQSSVPLARALRQQRAERAGAVEARAHLLLEYAPDPLVVVGEGGRIALVNAQVEQLFGFSRERLIGQAIDLLIPERFQESHRKHLREYMRSPAVRETGSGLDLFARRADGSEFPVDIRLSPLRTDEGLFVISSIRDVSDRQRVMSALRESEERFRSSFEHSPIPKALVDLDGRILRVNRALCDYLGYSEAELLSLTFHAVSHPDDLAADAAGVQQLLSGASRSFQMEKRYRHKQGSTLRGELSVSLVRSHEGDPLYFIRQIKDVTDRKRAEQELHRHAEMLRRQAQLIDSAHDAIIVRDLENRIVFWNRGAELTYGFSREEALGQTLWQLLQTRNATPEPHPPGETMQSLILKRGTWDGELLHTRKDGQVLTVDVRQILQRDERGEPLAILAINRDITPHKHAMAALRESEARAAAEALAMTRLYDLGTRLLSCTELTDALEETLDAAMELLGADMGHVQLISPASGGLEIAAQRGFTSDTLNHFTTVDIHDGSACARALHDGQRVVIEDVQLDAGFAPHRRMAAAAGYRAVQATPLTGRNNKVLGVLSTHWREAHRAAERELRALDLYARQATEFIEWMQLLQSERQNSAQLHAVLETLPVGVWLADRDGNLVMANPAGRHIWGEDELVSRADYSRYRGWYVGTGKPIGTDDWGMARAVERGEVSRNEEIEIEGLDGVRRTVLHSAVPIRSEDGQIRGGLVVIEDITALRKATEDREKLLEATIREAHHRIKNNLQAITDLLSLELAVSDSAAGEVLRDSIERVQAIALVHDLLSRDEQLECVSLRHLTERLVPAVLQANTRGAGRVVPDIQVLDVFVPSKQATALALILNELITNTAKHALGDRPSARLEVRLTKDADQYHLCVQDDGPGLHPGFDFEQHANVGMQVVRTLAEGSLRGRLTLHSGPGLRAEIHFPVAGPGQSAD